MSELVPMDAESRRLQTDFIAHLSRPRMCCWSIRCTSDPRWNKSGTGLGLVCTGGPQEMKDWVAECCEKYGEPPDDAVQGFEKTD